MQALLLEDDTPEGLEAFLAAAVKKNDNNKLVYDDTFLNYLWKV